MNDKGFCVLSLSLSISLVPFPSRSYWIYSRFTCTAISPFQGLSLHTPPTQHSFEKKGGQFCTTPAPDIRTKNCITSSPHPPPPMKNKSPRACACLPCRTVCESASTGGKTCAMTVRKSPPPLKSRLRTVRKMSALFYPPPFLFFFSPGPPALPLLPIFRSTTLPEDFC